MILAFSGWWVVGWVVGAVVVLIAAALVLTVIALARRIIAQADAITEAIDGARAHTEPLFDVKGTNLAVDRVTRGLRAVRRGEP